MKIKTRQLLLTVCW